MSDVSPSWTRTSRTSHPRTSHPRTSHPRTSPTSHPKTRSRSRAPIPRCSTCSLLRGRPDRAGASGARTSGTRPLRSDTRCRSRRRTSGHRRCTTRHPRHRCCRPSCCIRTRSIAPARLRRSTRRSTRPDRKPLRRRRHPSRRRRRSGSPGPPRETVRRRPSARSPALPRSTPAPNAWRSRST